MSLVCARNLGPILDGLLRKGPANRAFNCSDSHIPWEDIIREYCSVLEMDVPSTRRPPAGILLHTRDKALALLYSFSAFGAHFPSGLLMEHLGNPGLPYNWRPEVKVSVRAFFRNRK